MNEKTKMTLTEKEAKLFTAIAKGMDEPRMGWLHELAEESHSTAGVLGSLIKKGLVISEEEEGCTDNPVPCYWVFLTDEGEAHSLRNYPEIDLMLD